MNLSSASIKQILSHGRGLELPVVEGLLRRFESEYLQTFLPSEIARHIRALVKLSADNPSAVLLDEASDGIVECVVLAFDHPFEFSCITGVMAGTGYSIESSDAFTLPRVKPAGRKQKLHHRQPAIRRRDPLTDPVILDFFRGKLLGPEKGFRAWVKTFEPAVAQVIQLLDQEQEESTERAKRLVNERVTRWLKARRQSDPGSFGQGLLEVNVEQPPTATRLLMRAPNTPAFLYALSTALSLHGLQIERTRARTAEGNAIDEIDIVDADGKPVTNADSLQELQRSVLLTLQFSYFLDRAPDPLTALQRFEELSRQIVAIPEAGQWLELLRNPATMTDLAKVLGASHYLWEDFIRWHADALLPLLERRVRGEPLCPPMASLPGRLEESLVGAKNFDDQRNRLNEFKDRELFLIDLDHVLAEENPDAAFQLLSERLVFLAENLVATASRVVYLELVRLYGNPRNGKKGIGFAIFGLGKLGGVALGYASDIELLFLFEDDGESTGGSRGSLTNAEFFAILARETVAYMQAKREGIFQVDLRLRPFGSAGPLATSRRDFSEYYGPHGRAHAFERLALVRLRWIAGDSRLGYEIEQIRDGILYEDPNLEFESVWEISAKMRGQHMRGGKHNAKHGSGALADLEQMVQMLQLTHAKEAPQLRTPRLHEALDGLRRAAILSASEFEQLMLAYQFLRRLINAQRMLRGSAKDLFLPNEDSNELVHLARRMRYASDDPGAELLSDFTKQTDAVKKFMRRRFPRAQ
jgi:glutamate-ammonia-ligase adenylyltransferase